MLRLALDRLPRVLPTLVTRSRPIIRAAAISRLYSFLIRPSCSSKPYNNRAVG